jgi:hypothetical protein
MAISFSASYVVLSSGAHDPALGWKKRPCTHQLRHSSLQAWYRALGCKRGCEGGHVRGLHAFQLVHIAMLEVVRMFAISPHRVLPRNALQRQDPMKPLSATIDVVA